MKSSSELFPVSLLKADFSGDFAEDTYLIKHNLDEDQSVQIAVSRLGGANLKPSTGSPLVLVHGSFTNRGFWLSSKGQGFARYLADQGFDVWMMEARGHGLSPHNNDYVNNTVERYALSDLPAVHNFVHEVTGRYPAWIGHSLGGTTIATAIAAKTFDVMPPAIVMIGTQTVRRNWYWQIPLVGPALRLAVQFRKGLDGRQLNIGPENEPAGVINEYIARHSLFGRWVMPSTGNDLMAGWRKSTVPLLGVSGAADRTDPAEHCERFYRMYGGPKEDMLLGRESGYSKDFAHIDMIVGADAEKEVWPKISRWLAAYASK